MQVDNTINNVKCFMNAGPCAFVRITFFPCVIALSIESCSCTFYALAFHVCESCAFATNNFSHNGSSKLLENTGALLFHTRDWTVSSYFIPEVGRLRCSVTLALCVWTFLDFMILKVSRNEWGAMLLNSYIIRVCQCCLAPRSSYFSIGCLSESCCILKKTNNSISISFISLMTCYFRVMEHYVGYVSTFIKNCENWNASFRSFKTLLLFLCFKSQQAHPNPAPTHSHRTCNTSDLWCQNEGQPICKRITFPIKTFQNLNLFRLTNFFSLLRCLCQFSVWWTHNWAMQPFQNLSGCEILVGFVAGTISQRYLIACLQWICQLTYCLDL